MTAVFFTVGEPQAGGLKTSTGVPLERALRFEYEGTRDTAAGEGIPNFTVELDGLSPREVGELLAFVQYAFGVYPALLRDVNPFDQPQVESSKQISRELREKYLKK
jgi:glucose-6-phosphate isomerase